MDIIKRIPRSINPKNIPRNFKNLNKNNPLNQLNLKDISKNISTRKLPKQFKNNVFIHFIIIFIILIVIGSLVYNVITKEVPTTGGVIREGIIGQPQYINPVLSFSNDVNKPDRVLEYLIYPALFRLDTEGNLVNELVENYTVGDNGKEYIFKIKSGITWDDNTPLTIDDIIFTIETIQNPDYNSPLNSALKGVVITRVDDSTLKLNLNASYSPFLSGLTFGILPKHIWQNLEPSAFLLAKANLEPIGAGKFRYKSIQKKKDGNIESITIERNPNYFGEKPNIDTFILEFYKQEDIMIKDFKQNELQAITILKSILEESDKFQTNILNTPQSFGIIFNVKDPLLSNREIRQAIANSINRDDIINNILKGKATKINGVFTPFNKFYIDTPTEQNIENAQKILDAANWKDVDGDGIREKDNQRAEFTLLVASGNKVDEVTTLLQSQIKAIGIQMNTEVIPFNELSNNQIRNRSYQALFLGIALNIYTDPYIYWHSSQINSPGLNLAQYTNVNNDGYLETARTNTDTNVIASSLAQFQQQIVSDVPAIFMYSPQYLYYTNPVISNIKLSVGNSSVDRYASISEWYVMTKRVLK
ncbi:MAG: ABC transporter substrate-binding protein [Minisyncoccia bacterium]